MMRIIAVCDSCGTTATAARTRRKALKLAFGQGFKMNRVKQRLTCNPCSWKDEG